METAGRTANRARKRRRNHEKKTVSTKLTLRHVTLTGVMAAAVYVASAFLQIPIPTAIDSTRLHMGNVMCLLSGLLLGALPGGLAAGVGSMLFDLTNPAYVASAPFTFVFKFLMACSCGKIASLSRPGRSVRFAAGAFGGSALYILLYLSKSFAEHYFVLRLPAEAVLLPSHRKPRYPPSTPQWRCASPSRWRSR